MAGPVGKRERTVQPIPEPTLRRLPLYYQYLKKVEQQGQNNFISCTRIGSDLGILPIQVRKDLEITEAVGRPKLGYQVKELMTTISDFLGWNNTTDAYLVGVGNLGTALFAYQGFKEYGVNIVAGFDTDEQKVGKELYGKKILHVNKLPDMVKRMGIRIGILAVPAQSAQELADLMVKAGILAIWNFSPAKLNVRPGIIVQHENLASSLVVLSKKLALVMGTETQPVR